MSCTAHRWVDKVLGEQIINFTVNSMIRFFLCCCFSIFISFAVLTNGRSISEMLLSLYVYIFTHTHIHISC